MITLDVIQVVTIRTVVTVDSKIKDGSTQEMCTLKVVHLSTM